MKYPYLFCLIIACLLACKNQEQTNTEESSIKQSNYKLKLLWETPAQLPTVESVLYDSVSQFIYTANIDGHSAKKDGKGTIAKLDTYGSIIDAEWVAGIDAPTGLGIYEGKLYTTNIDEILIIDIATADILKRIPIPGATSLNDLAVDANGVVYFSDTDGNTIYKLENDIPSKLIEQIDSPNGLLIEGDELKVVCWNPKTMYNINLTDQSRVELVKGIEGLDGLEPIGNGDFLLSSFYGKLYYVTAKGDKSLLLDTNKKELSAADIDYVSGQKMVLVPTMDGNKVMAYRIEDNTQG